MNDAQQDGYRPTRRIVFSGLGALGVAAALAGCGSNNTGGTTPAADSSASGDTSTSGSPSAAGGKALAKTSEIPVGGGMILADQKIVITQPTAGQFKGFSAICTHQGFVVTSVESDLIKCSHHGSEYDAKDGSVVQGPAPAALKAVNVVVRGDSVFAA